LALESSLRILIDMLVSGFDVLEAMRAA